ncbi:MAG: glycosyltransferase family 2 protein [Planctomycetes bacterium]|nr:glycosyltransferase family 2 protein [Planctomycetota bacterium]
MVAGPAAEALSAARSACAIVVHHRDPAATRASLVALAGQQPELPVVVVDNSVEPGHELGAAPHALVRVLRAPRNDGFGAGVNLAIDALLVAGDAPDFVLLWNPDCRPRPGFLERLVRTAREHPDAGLVGPRVLDAAGGVWFESGRERRASLARMHVAAPADTAVHACDFVSGACCLVATDLLRAGLRFDPRYFLYVEDVDLGRQVRARGRRVLVDVRAEVVHAEGGSQRDDAGPRLLGLRERQLRWITRGKALYARKWFGPFERLRFALVALVAKPALGVLASGRLGFLPGYYAAFRDGWRAARRPAAAGVDGGAGGLSRA